MSSLKLSRRRFLKAGAVAGAAAVGYRTFSGLKPVDAFASEDKPKGEYGSDKKAQTWCEMCFWGCGVTASVRNGIVRKLEGQEKCPNNFGKLCAKGNSGVYQLYDPMRLKTPLIREGKRGEGKFRKATWDEAIKYIADKTNSLIEKHGKKTVALTCHGSGEHAFINLMELIGTHNVVIPAYSQCTGSREIGWYLTYGKPVGGKEYVDSDRTKCMMFLGRNVLEALHVGEAQSVIKGLSKGAKMIYVDPRYTKTAAKADKYMMINPGTDTALVLSMINYIITNRMYDKDFVDKYCYGLDRLEDHISAYTLEWAETETGIPARDIADACIMLGEAAPHCYIHPGRRLTRYGNDTQFTRAVAILNALFGNWEMPGGFYNAKGAGVKPQYHLCEVDTEEQAHDSRADGAGDTYPLAPANLGLANKLMDAIKNQEPYPIKALFIYGTNIFHHLADFEETKKTISQLDLLVTCDIYMTEAAYYSDVVLPDSTYLERQDPIKVNKGIDPYIQLREAAVEPVHNTMNPWQMVEKLAHAMGYDAEFKSIDRANEETVAQLGITLDKLREDGVWVGVGEPFPRALRKRSNFATPTRKIELFSERLKGMGFDPMPGYERPNYPKGDEFRLLFGRISYHTHARTQNIKWLLALHKYQVDCWIHKDRALKLGIRDGDKVILTKGEKKTPEMTAKVVEYIHPEAVFIPHGFGHFSPMMENCYLLGGSDADLCSNDTDPISGASAFHNAFVKVEKA